MRYYVLVVLLLLTLRTLSQILTDPFTYTIFTRISEREMFDISAKLSLYRSLSSMLSESLLAPLSLPTPSPSLSPSPSPSPPSSPPPSPPPPPTHHDPGQDTHSPSPPPIQIPTTTTIRELDPSSPSQPPSPAALIGSVTPSSPSETWYTYKTSYSYPSLQPTDTDSDAAVPTGDPNQPVRNAASQLSITRECSIGGVAVVGLVAAALVGQYY